MRPVRKNFESLPDFPFSLAFRDTKTPQNELPDHLHDWYELVYVHSGKGSFFIDRTIYEMRKGDLFIIPGNTIHRAFPDKEEPVTSTALFLSPLFVEQPLFGEAFAYLQCFDQSRKNRMFKMACSVELQMRIESLLNHIEAELRMQKLGYRHAVLLNTQQLLLEINRDRHDGQQQKSHAAFKGPNWVRDILLFIDKHFTEDIGLSSLCLIASVSPAHFSRVFKQLTGMNVTKFINVKRIVHAKELLLETEENVGTISAACGFESLPHFHQVFKKIAGVTPNQFRKQD
ncbi:helix-turn-helix domain-containing protein [Paenibacillus glycinis]|uniref:Helix-turn-helix domain-containing protein n=1 Tax=Paenibacillus glycinis TaxID=2697035 RepID=A0ABW9XZL0_9BACL|nr:AraC family transcriptional regulator [Paenibacillus glycinis]NBD28045.1 helix-turn-helix domain-containing protein [Paenibacillus glycinis]